MAGELPTRDRPKPYTHGYRVDQRHQYSHINSLLVDHIARFVGVFDILVEPGRYLEVYPNNVLQSLNPIPRHQVSQPPDYPANQ